MAFQVAARVVVQLGRELITEDSVALFELIKNAFDANSPKVTVKFGVLLQPSLVARIARRVEQVNTADADVRDLLRSVADDRNAEGLYPKGVAAVRELASSALSASKFLQRLQEIFETWTFIEVEDYGDGMSRQTMESAFLTLGTAWKLLEVKRQGRPLLGEKGIGRFATMRLGAKLHVRTAEARNHRWIELDVHWDQFDSVDRRIEDIAIEPVDGAEKASSDQKGTLIRITSLSSDWTEERVKDEFVVRFLARLRDPLQPPKRGEFPVEVFFNSAKRLPIPRPEPALLRAAHAYAHAWYKAGNPAAIASNRVSDSAKKDAGPRLDTVVEYRRGRATPLVRKTERVGEQLAERVKTQLGKSKSELPISDTAFETLGDFEVELYWWNRQVLEVKDLGGKAQVRAMLKKWTGGLAVYRDGFRVGMMGQDTDDWLELDPGAIGSSGAALNRAQLMGSVRITKDSNYFLKDLANREGFVHNSEFLLLRRLLQEFLVVDARGMLEAEEKELRRTTLEEIRTIRRDLQVRDAEVGEMLVKVAAKVEDVGAQTILHDIRRAVSQLVKSATSGLARFEDVAEKSQEILELAGIGLIAESVAHELLRISQQFLSSWQESSRGDARSEALITQMKAIRSKLRSIDELDRTGRTRKEQFDALNVLRQILHSHEAMFSRHHVIWSVSQGLFSLHMVRGLFYQVFENLISNSIYWLKREKKGDPDFRPEIRITVDRKGRRILFSDNGPGIDPEQRERVFDPFFSLKPRGKGLGLHIAREIATFHKASLYLSEDELAGRLHTFVLELPEGAVL